MKTNQTWESFTVVEVEEEAAHVFVVDFPSAIGFILRDDLQKQHHTFSNSISDDQPGQIQFILLLPFHSVLGHTAETEDVVEM